MIVTASSLIDLYTAAGSREKDTSLSAQLSVHDKADAYGDLARIHIPTNFLLVQHKLSEDAVATEMQMGRCHLESKTNFIPSCCKSSSDLISVVSWAVGELQLQ